MDGAGGFLLQRILSRSLSLSDNPLGNIEGLGSLSSVESLNLARTEISNLNPLQDVSIGSLNISGNNISTVPGLSIQHELRASDNELSNILSLIGLFEASPNLKLIDLSGNSIGPIIGIGPSNNFDQLSFDSLQELYIQRTGFRNVHFVPLTQLIHQTASFTLSQAGFDGFWSPSSQVRLDGGSGWH